MKPAAGYFTAVLDDLGIAQEKGLLVDDKARNVREAERLGLRGVTWCLTEGADVLRARLRAFDLPV